MSNKHFRNKGNSHCVDLLNCVKRPIKIYTSNMKILFLWQYQHIASSFTQQNYFFEACFSYYYFYSTIEFFVLFLLKVFIILDGIHRTFHWFHRNTVSLTFVFNNQQETNFNKIHEFQYFSCTHTFTAYVDFILFNDAFSNAKLSSNIMITNNELERQLNMAVPYF